MALLNFITPISKWVAKMHAPFTHKKIDYSITLSAGANLKSGSVLLSKSFGELANIIIPGDFSHAAIYDGEMIIEAKTKGVSRTSIYDFMMTKDDVIILEPLFCDDIGMKKAALKCLHMVGLPYDYNFDPSTKAFYCSELVSYGYSEFGKWNKRNTFGVETVVPDDFYKSAKSKTPKWRIVWDSMACKAAIDSAVKI